VFTGPWGFPGMLRGLQGMKGASPEPPLYVAAVCVLQLLSFK